MVKRGEKRVLEWAIYYEMFCKGCGKKYVAPLRKVTYCSKLCNNTHNKQFGQSHWHWKNGRISNGDGYIMVRVGVGRYQMEHRYLMEQKLGRKLTQGEVVHHINENKIDNRLENLQLMTRREHCLHHRPGDGNKAI